MHWRRGMPKKAPADSTMCGWWRKAIRAIYGHQCALSHLGDCLGQLEAHHIVKRRYGLLKHNFKCGVLLCKQHHNYAETLEGRDAVESLPTVDMDYLKTQDSHDFKQYLQDNHLSRAEFLCNQLDELKEICDNPKVAKYW